MTIVIPINCPRPSGLLTAAMSCAIVTFSAFFNKNPETAKHFGIFNINKVWRLLYHDHLSYARARSCLASGIAERTFGRTQASLVLLSLNHDLLSIPDVETLTWLSDTLALEGVPFSLAFGEGWGEVLDTRRTIIITANATE